MYFSVSPERIQKRLNTLKARINRLARNGFTISYTIHTEMISAGRFSGDYFKSTGRDRAHRENDARDFVVE